MNLVELVYKETDRVFNGSSLLFKLVWVLLLGLVSVMFFSVVFTTIGFEVWKWHLTGVASVLTVGGFVLGVQFGEGSSE